MAETEPVNVLWYDTQLACIDCPCGKNRGMMIHADGKFVSFSQPGFIPDDCGICGRKFRLVQYVEVVA